MCLIISHYISPERPVNWPFVAVRWYQTLFKRTCHVEVWTYSRVPALMGNYRTDPGILWGVNQDMYFQYYTVTLIQLS